MAGIQFAHPALIGIEPGHRKMTRKGHRERQPDVSQSDYRNSFVGSQFCRPLRPIRSAPVVLAGLALVKLLNRAGYLLEQTKRLDHNGFPVVFSRPWRRSGVAPGGRKRGKPRTNPNKPIARAQFRRRHECALNLRLSSFE